MGAGGRKGAEGKARGVGLTSSPGRRRCSDCSARGGFHTICRRRSRRRAKVTALAVLAAQTRTRAEVKEAGTAKAPLES